MGCRGYEHRGVKPLFAFGHGLSYTTFEYGKVSIRPATTAHDGALYEVEFTVTNVGTRPGAAVPQLYVASPKSRVARPPRELRGFAKVMLQPGASRTIVLPLGPRAFTYYDVDTKRWRADAGTYQILLGSSAEQIETQRELTIAKSIVVSD